MKEFKKRTYLYYVGIDVSKQTLDISVITEHLFLFHKVIKNAEVEINTFVKELKQLKGLTLKNTVFGMEHTGIYNNYLRSSLSKCKANFVIDNPVTIKNTMGLVRGKNDKLDSKRIAEYLVKNRTQLRLYVPKRPLLLQLASLSTLRQRLVSTRTALKNPLKEDLGFVSKAITSENIKLCINTIQSLDSDIKSVDEKIKELWSSDDILAHKMQLVLSVPSIGPVVALQILITTNEFLDITNPKSFACYCGVAPFEYSSGTTIRKRTENSSIANKRMKSLLHNSAIVAIAFSSEMRKYYLRKTVNEHKSKLSVINAVRFKIICRVFACIKYDRPYEMEYKSTHFPQRETKFYSLIDSTIINRSVLQIR
ncbi:MULTISPECIES: IS110 family transposase [unclassified Pedobacter]|uniref:IS110 family transposase n=1 Tax=unclassified Pedobacter TaxID=2628915 RepID=UPI001E102581|nr:MULTISPECIES: IS110 family transposase [unclassified Pedobacter]CAH0186098.1 hypothetical protein SRABI36_01631 [Pedobacter sp. Bi36]CAH0241866.1 hypothetical protein SRABI126_02724 [Pedobacter sp. Bi126]